MEELIYQYPQGNLRLESEVKSLKRKLSDFSDSDNEDLIRATIQAENKCNEDLIRVTIQAENEWNELKTNNKENQVKKQQIKTINVNQKLSCEQCGTKFNHKRSLERHIRAHTANYPCKICNKKFKRKDNLKEHEKHHKRKLQTTDERWKCNHCDCLLDNYEHLVEHVTKHHSLQKNQSGGGVIQPISTESSNQSISDKVLENEDFQSKNESALNNAVQDKVIFPNVGERYDLLTYFAMVRPNIESFLKKRLERGSIKYYISVQVETYRNDIDHDNTSQPHFRGHTYILLNSETFNEHDLNESFQKMFQSFETYIRESSGWLLRKVLHLKIHTINYKPLGGSSFIHLPSSLERSECIINIHNKDNKCFLWSILASLHPMELNPENVDHYTSYEHTLNLDKIDFPVSISQIDKFENLNKSVSVNVFAYEDKEIIPLKITKHVTRQHHVNLLLLKTEKVSHYCLIKNLNRFLSRTKKRKSQMYFCSYCLHGFTTEKVLNDHTTYCSLHGPQKVVLPDHKNALLKFSDYEKTQEVPFVIYCDFEYISGIL